jgi:hypothetical protein
MLDTPPPSPGKTAVQLSPSGQSQKVGTPSNSSKTIAQSSSNSNDKVASPTTSSEVAAPSSSSKTIAQSSPSSSTKRQSLFASSGNNSASSSPEKTKRPSIFSIARAQHVAHTAAEDSFTLKYYDGEKDSEGLPHGHGKYSYVDGSFYEGNWDHGKRHGKGTWTYINGDVYTGDWENSHKHGTGTWTLSNGDRYEGDFCNDARNGKGAYYFRSGDSYVGDYVNDIKEGEGEYIAMVTTPCRDVAVSGKFRYFESDHYIGHYKNNNRHGFGKQWSKNGDYYEGEWVDHYKNGRGKLIKANGHTVEGIWEDEQLVYTFPPPTVTPPSNACAYITCAAVLIACAYILGLVTMALLNKPVALCLPPPNVVSLLEDKSGGCRINATSLVKPIDSSRKVQSILSVVCNISTNLDDTTRSYIVGMWYDIPLDVFDEIHRLEGDHSWDIRSDDAVVTVSNYSYNYDHHSHHNTNFNDKLLAAMNQSTILYVELKLDSIYANSTENVTVQLTLPIRYQALIESHQNSNSDTSLLPYNIYGIMDDVVEYRMKTDRTAHSNDVLQLPMPVKPVEVNYKTLYFYGLFLLALNAIIGVLCALCCGCADSESETVYYNNIDDTIEHAVYVQTVHVNMLIVNMFEGASRHSNSFNVKVATDSGKVVVFNRAGHKSKYNGQLVITDGMPYGQHIFYGRIDVNGTLYLTRSATTDVTEVIQEFSANPAVVAARYGRTTGGCSFCHHPLSDARSVTVGYGLKCAKRYGLPWGV